MTVEVTSEQREACKSLRAAIRAQASGFYGSDGLVESEVAFVGKPELGDAAPVTWGDLMHIARLLAPITDPDGGPDSRPW